MAVCIHFFDQHGGIVSTVLCTSEEQAQFELRNIIVRYEMRGWTLTCDEEGDYAAIPPLGAVPPSSEIRKIAVKLE